ncbi:hypothetical protein PVK06_004545 [Gossypium arboreum]|uniref:Reverse transcriptase n=1 Tax=Gossypium arboreum TaxID=29729 RepID=A0ABR0QS99_GOSAR|nr:hypothetical protein PVK06_004545 [Gossypium arboreum]
MYDHCSFFIHTDEGANNLSQRTFRVQYGVKSWVASAKFKRVGQKKDLTEKLEILLYYDKTDENLADLIETKIHINLKINKDEMYWEQRASANWLKLGDKNTTFFHRYASQRRRKNTIQSLRHEDERETSETDKMENIARDYFKKLFTSNRSVNTECVISGIERSSSEDVNLKLISNYMKEEVVMALKELGLKKASGDDGFPALFF